MVQIHNFTLNYESMCKLCVKLGNVRENEKQNTKKNEKQNAKATQ